MALEAEHDGLILDACCIINLYAGGALESILKWMQTPVYVDSFVKNKEVLVIRGEGGNSYEEIDLSRLIDEKVLIEISQLNPKETETFVDFAISIDDGEARCGALALHRKLSVVSDDKAAIRLFRERMPSIHIYSTLELLHLWADENSAKPEELKKILTLIESRASYRPGKNHPFYKWWEEGINYLGEM